MVARPELGRSRKTKTKTKTKTKNESSRAVLAPPLPKFPGPWQSGISPKKLPALESVLWML